MSATNVAPFYRSVIDDVINNVKEAFLDEGVDEQVLLELKQTWESRLAQTKAVPSEQPPAATQQQHYAMQQVHAPQHTGQQHSVHAPQTVQYQITTLSETGEQVPKTITITLPSTMQGAPAGIVMSGPASAAMASLQAAQGQGIPTQIAMNTGGTIQRGPDGRTIQYQSITAEQLAKQGYTLNIAPPGTTQPTQVQMQQLNMRRDIPPGYMLNMPQGSNQSGQAHAPSSGGVFQLDGANDDDDTSDDDDDDDDEDIEDEEHAEDDIDGAEDEVPLNSEDDVSNEDPSEVFETDNVIVCQFDKITRSRNKWKFHFKDGIMNLQGKDYVFQRALGDAEW